ncbi:hypothetical protein Glove_279g49 [Diversispora epigaea]|uniref:Uncharacterized protein n=1 Tax=Diversispora epigaea TaxID=1348612 RepID=A0A397I3L2_9GLOM|nr:hypothetical protein Glove_279g49 [Diversispora epigaea]
MSTSYKCPYCNIRYFSNHNSYSQHVNRCINLYNVSTEESNTEVSEVTDMLLDNDDFNRIEERQSVQEIENLPSGSEITDLFEYGDYDIDASVSLEVINSNIERLQNEDLDIRSENSRNEDSDVKEFPNESYADLMTLIIKYNLNNKAGNAIIKFFNKCINLYDVSTEESNTEVSEVTDMLLDNDDFNRIEERQSVQEIENLPSGSEITDLFEYGDYDIDASVSLEVISNISEHFEEILFEKDSTYPLDNRILYKEIVNNVTKRSFNYIIIKEGIYLDENDKNTNKQFIQCYKIPHNYVVKTTWGRGKKKRTVQCEIEYIDNKLQYYIKYGSNFEHIISSNKSSSNVANNLIRTLNPETKALISGPLLFGLQLDSVRKARNAKKKGNLIKQSENCSLSTLEKRAKKIATKTKASFNDSIKQIYHQSDNIKLEAVKFSVNKMDFRVNIGRENQVKTDHKFQSIVKAIDQGRISQDAYRNLASAEYHLPREYLISNKRIEITDHMNEIVKFSLVQMEKNNLDNIELAEADITNSEIEQEVINTMGLGIR